MNPISAKPKPAFIQGWVRHPQRTLLRKALFQVHLWSGIALGMYIFFISVTGSVLVYRNELLVMTTPAPLVSTATTPLLDDSALKKAAMSAHPGFRIVRLLHPPDANRAVEVWLENDHSQIRRLIDPRTGADRGSAEALGMALVFGLMAIHDNLLAGPSGRLVNGFAALAVLLVAVTGLVIWWPGSHRWQRSLVLRRGVGWKRFTWDLHSMMGFWSAAFILVFAASGAYLCFPETVHALADCLQPMTADNAGQRLVDKVLYWLAFLHFGRINGIGLPCDGPGLCDQSVKAVWALFGLAPAAMFVTGATLWWQRVVKRWLKP